MAEGIDDWLMESAVERATVARRILVSAPSYGQRPAGRPGCPVSSWWREGEDFLRSTGWNWGAGAAAGSEQGDEPVSPTRGYCIERFGGSGDGDRLASTINMIQEVGLGITTKGPNLIAKRIVKYLERNGFPIR